MGVSRRTLPKRNDVAKAMATIAEGQQISKIQGVLITSLKQIPDERGKVMHMLRCDAPHFLKFGEIYFSVVFPGVIKGWHWHRTMGLNYAVAVGNIKLVLYDDRPDSPTRSELQEIFIGESHYALVTIPPQVWNGFKGIGVTPAVVANCATETHDPDEIVRLNPFSEQIPYDWELKHR